VWVSACLLAQTREENSFGGDAGRGVQQNQFVRSGLVFAAVAVPEDLAARSAVKMTISSVGWAAVCLVWVNWGVIACGRWIEARNAGRIRIPLPVSGFRFG
jgi:hypothetical protein